jgi:hypothetical protein
VITFTRLSPHNFLDSRSHFSLEWHFREYVEFPILLTWVDAQDEKTVPRISREAIFLNMGRIPFAQ